MHESDNCFISNISMCGGRRKAREIVVAIVLPNRAGQMGRKAKLERARESARNVIG
jgi:hypothetical protein